MYIAGMDIGGTKCASILAEVTKESVRFFEPYGVSDGRRLEKRFGKACRRRCRDDGR